MFFFLLPQLGWSQVSCSGGAEGIGARLGEAGIEAELVVPGNHDLVFVGQVRQPTVELAHLMYKSCKYC